MQRSFKFQGVQIWNSMPIDLRKLSFNQFKMKYKKPYFLTIEVSRLQKIFFF